MNYQLINDKTIRRLSDGASIPADEQNGDYREFLRWKAAGNEPLPAEPAPGPTPQQQIVALEARQTPRLIREATLGGEYAKGVLADIDAQIDVLRASIK